MLSASMGTGHVDLPSPCLLFSSKNHHSPYENRLETNVSCLLRPLPDLGACPPTPIPFSFLGLAWVLGLAGVLLGSSCCLWPPGRWLTLQWTEQQGDRCRGLGGGMEEEESRGRRTSNLYRLDLVHLGPHHLDTVQDFFLVAS